jgi:UDP-3-O-[3-hydroxymyristoyl] glucosamine N-acyltransferase
MIDQNFHKKSGSYKLSELAEIAGAEIFNKDSVDIDLIINDVAPLDEAGSGQISFFGNAKYLEAFQNSKASAFVMAKSMIDKAPKGAVLLIAKDPNLSFAKISSKFYPATKVAPLISEKSSVASSATLGKNIRIEPFAVIGENVKLGDNCYIGSGTLIGDNVEIGDNSYIASNVTITHAIIGKNALFHPGVRIGQDGFGFAQEAGVHFKVPQLGRVIIGDFVEIGANSCIDRGALKDTKIADHTKIDNLVQLGHNVELGKGCFIVSQVGIAGSTKLGDYVVVGGQVGIAGHLNVGSMTQIAAKSGVAQDLKGGQAYGGAPAQPIREWQRQMFFLQNLYKKTKKTNNGELVSGDN